jgi:pimeloyl-ACP methyl ester carboxylesterase
LVLGALVPAILAIVLLVRLIVKYAPIIGRMFEEQPFFLPLRVTPEEFGEPVAFLTEDGLRLSGSYFGRRTEQRAGVFVYCHEYLSDQWSFRPYIDPLRDLGFDLFTFDFRSHGASATEPGYTPMYWASDREVRDLRAALEYLRSRPDRDPAGYGLFGVSRGGTTALLAAAAERDVWGVITDGAFPTKGMMVSYSVRWTELFVKSPVLRRLMPRWLYVFLASFGRRRAERRRNCRFPDVEKAVARLAPRPWLMIHGQRDAYVSPEVARGLFRFGNGPKELWLVPDAKHNRCRESKPEAYAARLLDFIDRFAPRRPILGGVLLPSSSSSPPAAPRVSSSTETDRPREYAGELAGQPGKGVAASLSG